MQRRTKGASRSSQPLCPLTVSGEEGKVLLGLGGGLCRPDATGELSKLLLLGGFHTEAR